jgi:hypothetical protein
MTKGIEYAASNGAVEPAFLACTVIVYPPCAALDELQVQEETAL